jgi:SPP1 family predicted phage head-tail adaptor
MLAGKLRERVTFEKLVPAGGDADWGDPTAWIGDGTVWASVTPNNGNEKAGKDGVVTVNSYTIRTRYREGITSQHRIKWRLRTMDILSVVDVDRSWPRR